MPSFLLFTWLIASNTAARFCLPEAPSVVVVSGNKPPILTVVVAMVDVAKKVIIVTQTSVKCKHAVGFWRTILFNQSNFSKFHRLKSKTNVASVSVGL